MLLKIESQRKMILVEIRIEIASILSRYFLIDLPFKLFLAIFAHLKKGGSHSSTDRIVVS